MQLDDGCGTIMLMTVGELRNIVKEETQHLRERAHTGHYTIGMKFDPHVYDADDVYHAAMDEYYGVASDLEISDPSDPVFVGYIMDKLAGLVPQDIMDAVRAKLVKKAQPRKR